MDLDEHVLGCVVGVSRADGPSDKSMQPVLVPENQRVEGSPFAIEESIHKRLVVGIAESPFAHHRWIP